MAATIAGGSGIPEAGVPHLERLRPVFAARAEVEGTRDFTPWLWVFERVQGARITGTHEPGARVTATLHWRVYGNPLIWSAWTDADSDGRYRIKVPLPTGAKGGGIHTGPIYEIRSGGNLLAQVAVPEQAVVAGLPVPPLLVGSR